MLLKSGDQDDILLNTFAKTVSYISTLKQVTGQKLRHTVQRYHADDEANGQYHNNEWINLQAWRFVGV